MNKCVVAGVDLGTYSACSAMLNEQGMPVAMKNAEGEFSTRSVVLFPPGEQPIIGRQALNAALLYPDGLLAREMKLHVGEKDSQGADIVTVLDSEGRPRTAVEIQGMVAEKLIKDINAQIPSPITHIVIAVPANYTSSQRETVMKIGAQIGCTVLGVVEEPVAVAYAVIQTVKALEHGMYLVFDPGAGTTDVSLLDVTGAGPRIQATNGKSNLGGRRFDMALIEVIAGKARAAAIDIEAVKDAATLHEFHEKVECAKHTLSQSEKALFYMNMEGKVLKAELLRPEFEKASKPILTEIKGLIVETLNAAKLESRDIKGVLLNGPSCLMPMIPSLLNEVLPGVPLRRDLDPVTGVSLGAAIVAAKYAQQDGNEAISKAGTRLRALDAVATLRSVSTHGLGCEYLVDGNRNAKAFAVIIPANTPLPARKCDRFATVEENQTSVDVKVCQAEGMTVEPYVYVATVRLEGIPPGHLGEARIVVEYAYNRSGVVEVTVTDTVSKKSVSSNVSHNLGNI